MKKPDPYGLGFFSVLRADIPVPKEGRNIYDSKVMHFNDHATWII